jgi:hypothetical protein
VGRVAESGKAQDPSAAEGVGWRYDRRRRTMSAEVFELSPDGRRSIATFRTLEAAVEQAAAMLSTRPDVGQFRIYAARPA